MPRQRPPGVVLSASHMVMATWLDPFFEKLYVSTASVERSRHCLTEEMTSSGEPPDGEGNALIPNATAT